jgi:hypothetical protein
MVGASSVGLSRPNFGSERSENRHFADLNFSYRPVPDLQPSQNLPRAIAQGLAAGAASSDPIRIVFGAMSFAPDSDRLTDVGAGRCYLVLKKFRQHKTIKVIVESASGRMEGSGQDLELNRRRAETLREKLHALGVPRELMSTPISGGDERAGRPGSDWARPTPPKVEFVIRVDSNS